ncbi:unnamed protein product [Polarella glacialis]|uniref:Uncharacterized protein n=1 Tax=Polarella glacialis TaxID=89957 RepID=A0A813F8H1_POLGL|nr:unnamed protein product [Polarella glacialis]
MPSRQGPAAKALAPSAGGIFVPGAADADAVADAHATALVGRASAEEGNEGMQFLCAKYSSLMTQLRQEMDKRQKAEAEVRLLEKRLHEESSLWEQERGHWAAQHRQQREELAAVSGDVCAGGVRGYSCDRYSGALAVASTSSGNELWASSMNAEGADKAAGWQHGHERLLSLFQEHSELQGKYQDVQEQLAASREQMARLRRRTTELESQAQQSLQTRVEAEAQSRHAHDEMRQALRSASVARSRERAASQTAGRGERELRSREERLRAVRHEASWQQACVCTLYLNTLKLSCTGTQSSSEQESNGGSPPGSQQKPPWGERRHRRLKEVSPSELTALIEGSERLVMSQDGFAVAACNGHYVQGVFGPGEWLAPADVPEHLFHGSLERHRRSIMEEGLRGNRPVHLVDERFGKWKTTYNLKVVVRARAAAQKGIRFRVNDNGVYLAEQSLPPVWIAGVEHWPKRGPSRARGSIVQSVRESGDRCGTCSPRRRRSSEAAVEYLDAKASASSRASAPSLPLASPEEADVSRQVDSRALSDMLAKHYKMDLITEDFAFSEHLSEEDSSPVPHAQPSFLVSEADIEGMATVAAWRSDNGFQESKDFAFAFTSETEARDEGGEVMVTAWLATRAQEMSVVGAGAAAVLRRVAEPVVSSPSSLPSSRPKALPVSKAKLTAREATPAADDEKKRVVLGELFSFIRKTPTHPWVLEAASSGLTNAEFDEFLVRRMQALLRFELRSLRSGQMAFSRLAAFKPGASLFGNPMLVEAYLASLLRPTSTYNSLYWVQRHLNFELGMLSVLKPTGACSSGAVGAGTRQAVVAEPAMLFTLGKKAEAFKAAGDVRWMALVVAHVLSSGTMRQRHLQRSRLVKLTDTAAFFVCSKGKTKARDAFNWSCPCFSVDGVNMMAMWHQEVRRLSDAGTEVRCLAFNLESGQPLAFSAMIAAWRSSFSVLNPELITSYPFRRVSPTVANAIALPWELRLALGAWQESPGGPKAEVVSLMPVRYADNRDSIQCLVKLALRLGWQGLFETTSGSAVPCLWGNCLTQMRSWDLRALMDASAVSLDGTVAVFETHASEARKFVMAEDVPAGQVDADDSDSDLSPSRSCDEEETLGKIFFSMAGQPGAKVHLRLQAWSRWDSEATPLCKRRQKASQPLAAPIAVGEGLTEAAGVGPICADCARAHKSQ